MKPILFSPPMVRAIQDGRKTQTRRVFKEAKPSWRLMTPEEWKAPTPNRPAIGGCPQAKDGYPAMFWTGTTGMSYPCPYGKPGDKLWVRESWAALKNWDMYKPREIVEGSEIYYQVDPPTHSAGKLGKWRSSRFMPRWASRITLEITDIRVERVQDISEADALAEGVTSQVKHSAAFADLWDSLNAKRGYGWEANPWVWVITFKKSKVKPHE
jgi:hypothetical protein